MCSICLLTYLLTYLLGEQIRAEMTTGHSHLHDLTQEKRLDIFKVNLNTPEVVGARQHVLSSKHNTSMETTSAVMLGHRDDFITYQTCLITFHYVDFTFGQRLQSEMERFTNENIFENSEKNCQNTHGEIVR